jgi:glycosyltransferase involved in cell wall biosynthesis
LVVSTLEPRKRHEQILNAFEYLWTNNIDVSLVFVGKSGWKIDQLTAAIKNHSELDKRLFWLKGVDDQFLDQIYQASTCLINASEGEGFGLPLIEAAQYKLPIIARDIPVFREVVGDSAYYFNGADGKDLAIVIQDWVELYRQGKAPTSEAVPWLTWKQSTENLLQIIFHK